MAGYGPEEFQQLLERLVEWSANIDKAAAFKMIAKQLKEEHFGVETVCLTDQHNSIDGVDAPEMQYLNMGETYATTLVLDTDDDGNARLQVTSWGDWYENAQKEFCREHEVAHCPNCGRYSYNKETCEHCQYNLG